MVICYLCRNEHVGNNDSDENFLTDSDDSEVSSFIRDFYVTATLGASHGENCAAAPLITGSRGVEGYMRQTQITQCSGGGTGGESVLRTCSDVLRK